MARHYGDPPGSGVSRLRNLLLAVLVLVAVALVGLGTGFLLSLTENGADSTNAGRTTSPRPSGSSGSTGSTGSAGSSGSATPTPRRPTVASGSQIERGRTQDLGFFLGARRTANGLTHVAFDRVQLLRGDAAEKYAKAHGGNTQTASNGLIVNENPRTRDLVLAPDVKVFGGVQLAASSDPERVPVQTLLDALDSEGANIQLELRFDKLGYVVQVTEKRYA